MRESLNKWRRHDPRITFRGAETTRLDNLTDAVFGIAITLLIFNLSNPNSFSDLLDFAKTLPAFLISIAFLILVWTEHVRFSEVYSIHDPWFMVLNTGFIALVIFYVYPLRFLALVLTNLYFSTDIPIRIEMVEVTSLMVYFGIAVFALYFVLFVMYLRAYRMREALDLNAYELFYTKWHIRKAVIMWAVPLISVLFVLVLQWLRSPAAAFVGGMLYWLYTPAMLLWNKRFDRRAKAFDL